MDKYDWLEQVAYKKMLLIDDPMNCSFSDNKEEYEVWLSKFDDSYVTMVGMEDNISFLADLEITEQLTHGVGFSPKDGKWYGWSHRAIYGFKVGSTCKKGDCHYRASSIDEEIEDSIRFFSDDNTWTKAKRIAWNKIIVFWQSNDSAPNEKARNIIGRAITYFNPNNFGKGEWVATTIEDAKQMAIDFNEGVS